MKPPARSISNLIGFRSFGLASVFLLLLSFLISLGADARPEHPPADLDENTGNSPVTQHQALVPPARPVQGTPLNPLEANLVHPPISNNHFMYILQDERGGTVTPLSAVRVDSDLYFLGSNCLWYCAGARPVAGAPDILILRKIEPTAQDKLGTPWQEFNDCLYLPTKKAIIILDKSGDLFQYSPETSKWDVFRANGPSMGSPDPDYISFCALGNELLLLDPERNQIWKTPGRERLSRLFPEVLPWRIKPGDIVVSDGVNIAFNDYLYVLRRQGRLTAFSGAADGKLKQEAINFHIPANFKPTRFSVSKAEKGTPVFYIVDWINNRVLRVNGRGGEVSAFLFPAQSSLRTVLPAPAGFWVVDGERFVYRRENQASPLNSKVTPRVVDPRLANLLFPVKGQRLPNHPGVFPGARRLYRYGVHEGLDIFDGVAMNTPLRAALGGIVVRCDSNFVDMTAQKYNAVMDQCRREHRTSEHNEDLFRGCQVWIDQGNGVIARYAHLNRVSPALKVNQRISRGELIGFAGVSGTGQNLPGKARYPHLHFELRIDGKYFGFGLTPQETISLYGQVFGRDAE
jgi:murein DD-endopeptidase MepM/ murein hydrolase activator NlpD